MSDPLIIAGQEFGSRLFLGTAGYPNRKIMLDAIEASGTAMVTASIRRISLAGDDESLIDLLGNRVRFLPNTAGCQTAKDAVLTAELAREALDTNWVKLEVIGDRELLYPDVEELVRATETLVAQGFYRAAVLHRGSGDLPQACGCGGRCRDAARLADRLGARHIQSASDRAYLRALGGAGGARRRHRHGLGCRACHGARLLGRSPQHRGVESARSGVDGKKHARRGRRRAACRGLPDAFRSARTPSRRARNSGWWGRNRSNAGNLGDRCGVDRHRAERRCTRCQTSERLAADCSSAPQSIHSPSDQSAAPNMSATASTPNPAASLSTARTLSGRAVDVVAVDMPLACSPFQDVVALMMRFREPMAAANATHSPNALRPGRVSHDLTDGFFRAGYPLQTLTIASPALIEVYPHPALVELAGAVERLPYKAAKVSAYWPKLSPSQRRQRLYQQWRGIIALLEREIAGVNERLSIPKLDANRADVKACEDMLDAIVCAWVGICALEGRATSFGDETSAIWIPAPMVAQRAYSCGAVSPRPGVV